jgi:hypothetical protein
VLHGPLGLVAKLPALELDASVIVLAELDICESETVMAPDGLPAVSV